MSLQEEDLADVTVSDGRKLVPFCEKAHKSHYIFAGGVPIRGVPGAGADAGCRDCSAPWACSTKGRWQELEQKFFKGWVPGER
jgi:hypothetical protein